MEADPAAAARSASERVDVVVVGAGFAGLYAAVALTRRGYTVQVIEAAPDVGGTWYWNCYPGARCDVESLEYSYQWDDTLQHEWSWSERYASQPEIHRYLSHVADRFDLRRLISFDERVIAMTRLGDPGRWRVTTHRQRILECRFVIMATGPLSRPSLPDIAGLDHFRGLIVHTARWPRSGIDTEGAAVAVIGTGSSAVQTIPRLAASARSLVVFQRTPAYVVPSHNGPLDPDFEQWVKSDYRGFRQRNSQRPRAFASHTPLPDASALEVSEEERRATFQRRWDFGGLTFNASFTDLMTDARANRFAQDFIRDKIREIVHDPEVARLLSPSHAVGCKRLCVEDHYYETFNRPNVELVDVSRQPIEHFTPKGPVIGSRSWDIDVLVLATGFQAFTGALDAVDITGLEGRSLRQSWAQQPSTYLGLMVPGFPNLFLVNGPGSPSVLTNMVVSIEHHVEWIADCIDTLHRSGRSEIVPRPAAADSWMAYVASRAEGTLFPTCSSWFNGANDPGIRRTFMPLVDFPPYAEKLREVVAGGYEGFDLT